MNIYRKKQKKSFFFSQLSATWFLIFITSAISLIAFISWQFNSSSISFFALQSSNFLTGVAPWTLILHMFVHANIFHLLVNMFVLFSLGGLCEKIIGKRRFLLVYLIAGIFAGILSVFLAGYFGEGFAARIFGTPDAYMVGASGAIFSIAGIFVVLLPKLRFSILFLPFFSLPAYVMVPLVLFLTWFATIAADLPVGNVAHFGGFLVGLTYGFYLRIKYRKKVAMLERFFR